jgi:hypothetical protein
LFSHYITPYLKAYGTKGDLEQNPKINFSGKKIKGGNLNGNQ